MKIKRESLLLLLGGRCNRCGFAIMAALQIDHVRGNGALDRSTSHETIARSFLADENLYQLLCANCNWIKREENKETRALTRREANVAVHTTTHRTRTPDAILTCKRGHRMVGSNAYYIGGRRRCRACASELGLARLKA